MKFEDFDNAVNRIETQNEHNDWAQNLIEDSPVTTISELLKSKIDDISKMHFLDDEGA